MVQIEAVPLHVDDRCVRAVKVGGAGKVIGGGERSSGKRSRDELMVPSRIIDPVLH
jgi:hypothetical protein